MQRFAKIAIDKASYSYDKIYDYILPSEYSADRGCRVVVPFGRGGERLGLILEINDRTDTKYQLKEIISVVDTTPVLDSNTLAVVVWLKENTYCTYFDALRAVIPTGLGQRINKGYTAIKTETPPPLTPREDKLYSCLLKKRKITATSTLTDQFPDVDNLIATLLEKGLVSEQTDVVRRVQDQTVTMVRTIGDWQDKKLTPKQQTVVQLPEISQGMSVKEVCYYTGVTKSVIDKLVSAEVAEYYDMETYRDPYANTDRTATAPTIDLSEQQQRACDELWKQYRQYSGATTLVFGVTGSGKTQVFLRHTQRVIADGRQAIILVPEISLTPQTISKFHMYFGERVAVLHSALSVSERLDEWKRIKRGEVDVVVGTRSAVFAPLPSPGLIVIDEEQEHTYKSESSPRFETRDIARLRMKLSGGMVLLASATPSVESYYRSQGGDYNLVELTERFGKATLPHVTLIDLRTQSITGGISSYLYDELDYNLQHGEQSILLMNRRGYSTQIKCLSCHKPAHCPHCSISMKYHTANNRLICHYCGYSIPLTQKCQFCGSEYVHHTGTGTQRVEQDLKDMFPSARILRMDTDTTMQKFSHQKHLSQFASGEYDIMVGTQMVAKGLDFPNVTLVGVLGIDNALYSQDFRSYERVFSLVTQVVGRSGRSEKRGRAFIETYTPENPILLSAAAQEYLTFYNEEIATRKYLLYPPFCRMCSVGIVGEHEKLTYETAIKVHEMIVALLKDSYSDIPVRLLGLSEATVYKVAGKFRYKILLKVKNNKRTRQMLQELLSSALALVGRDINVYIDPSYDGAI